MAVKEPVETTEDPWDKEDSGRVVEHLGSPDRDGMVVTVKAGTGFDAPWLVLHADSVEDAISKMQDDSWDELADLTARKAKAFAATFSGPKAAPKAPVASSGGWGAKKAPAKVQEPSEGPDCDHGERDWVTGNSKFGEWYAWMCPAEKDDPSKCDPIWAKADGSPKPPKR